MEGMQNGQSFGLGEQMGADVNSVAAAQAVGEEFVTQYYTVLRKQPHLLHRFYTEHSTVTYCEPGAEPQVIGTQQNIHEKMMSLGYQDADAVTLSVDAQYSLQQGVIVQVTGALQTLRGIRRNFVQTFFLAVQAKGYFVLNDVFRILPSVVQPLPSPQLPYIPIPVAPQQNGFATTGTQHHSSQQQQSQPRHLQHPPELNGQFYQQTAHRSPPIMPPSQPQQPQPPAEPPQLQQQQPSPQLKRHPSPPPPPPPPEDPVESPKAEAPQEIAPPPQEAAPPSPPLSPKQPPAADTAQEKAPSADQDEAPPKPEAEPEPAPPAVPLTYAERLKQGAAKAAPPRQAARPALKAQPHVQPQQQPGGTPSGQSAAGQGNGDRAGGGALSGPPSQPALTPSFPPEAPSCSVFVKDLPADITMERLAEAFGEIGPLASGSRAPVNLKVQKGKDSFAFVEFASAKSAEAAIKGPVIIDGQTVRVDDKRPMYLTHRPGRGGYSRSGSGYGEGGRGSRGYGDGGRGNFYGGGRGGRGPPGGRGDMIGGGRNSGGGGGGHYSGDGGRGKGPPRGRGSGRGGNAAGSGGRNGRGSPPRTSGDAAPISEGPADAAPAADVQ